MQRTLRRSDHELDATAAPEKRLGVNEWDLVPEAMRPQLATNARNRTQVVLLSKNVLKVKSKSAAA